MVQIELHLDRTVVAVTIVKTRCGQHETILLDHHRSRRHRIFDTRKVDSCAQAIDLDLSTQFGLATSSRELHLGVGRTLRTRNHTRQEGFDQAHRNIIDTRLYEVSLRVGSVVASYDGILALTVGQQQSGAVALHIPTRQHLHRRHHNIVHFDTVKRHRTVNSTTLQCRVHHRATVTSALDSIAANAFEQLTHGRKVEITQRKHHRVGHLLRRHTIEQQRLLIVAHHKSVDRDISGVIDNLLCSNMPRLVALTDIRRFQIDRDSARPVIVARQHRIDT